MNFRTLTRQHELHLRPFAALSAAEPKGLYIPFVCILCAIYTCFLFCTAFPCGLKLGLERRWGMERLMITAHNP
jgi:hypothetical protein